MLRAKSCNILQLITVRCKSYLLLTVDVVGFGEGFGLEIFGFFFGYFALEYVEAVIFKFLAVCETDDVVERRTADFDNLLAGIFLLDIAAYGLGNERLGHGLFLAINTGPAAFVAEFDFGAVG